MHFLIFVFLHRLHLLSYIFAQQTGGFDDKYQNENSKYYRITDAGLARIHAFKEEWREIMSIYQFVTKGDPEAHG